MILETPEPFVTLTEVQEFLDKTGHAAVLTQMTAAACEMIRDRIGEVSAVACRDTGPARCTVVLDHRPVISITSVTTSAGAVALDDVDLVSAEGIVELPATVRGTVTVLYQAGRDPVPGNIALAGLELVAHLWRNSQNAGSGGSRAAPGQPDATVMAGTAYSMPYRVRELLGLGKHQTDIPIVG